MEPFKWKAVGRVNGVLHVCEGECDDLRTLDVGAIAKEFGPMLAFKIVRVSPDIDELSKAGLTARELEGARQPPFVRSLSYVINTLRMFHKREGAERERTRLVIVNELRMAAAVIETAPQLRLDHVASVLRDTAERWSAMTGDAAVESYAYKDTGNFLRGVLAVAKRAIKES